MAAFAQGDDSVLQAVQAAQDLLRRVVGLELEGKLSTPLHIRIGVDFGEVMLDSKAELHGTTVNLAKRVTDVQIDDLRTVEGYQPHTALPEANRILITDAVQRLTEQHDWAATESHADSAQ